MGAFMHVLPTTWGEEFALISSSDDNDADSADALELDVEEALLQVTWHEGQVIFWMHLILLNSSALTILLHLVRTDFGVNMVIGILSNANSQAFSHAPKATLQANFAFMIFLHMSFSMFFFPRVHGSATLLMPVKKSYECLVVRIQYG